MQRDPIGMLIELTPTECREHLRLAVLGRLAITYKALPVVIPVRIAAHDGNVGITSLYGDVIPLPADSIVALEAGTLGEGRADEWSVGIRGVLTVNASADSDPQRMNSSEFQLSTEVLAGWERR
jgi:Pyridoxamine 5'-phosphate oxidase